MVVRGTTPRQLVGAAVARGRGTYNRAKETHRRRQALGKLASVRDLQAEGPEFERLRQLIRESGTDSLVHFDNRYTHEGGLSLQQNPDEFAALCRFLKLHGPYTTYVEIGTASGGSALLLSREVGFERAISIDDGQHPRAREQKINLAAIPNLRQFIGDSHEPAARAFLSEALDGAPIDLAFVDGDHSAEGVWQDIELTLPFCRPGALFVLHDTQACEGVELAWFRVVREGIVTPLAEFLGEQLPLGIGVGRIA
jgi:predicted O-methyltransferase YrrM